MTIAWAIRRPPHVVANSISLFVSAVLAFNPGDHAAILSQVIIFSIGAWGAFRHLRNADASKDDARRWLDYWVVASTRATVESFLGKNLALIFPLWWLCKVLGMMCILSKEFTLKRPKAKPSLYPAKGPVGGPALHVAAAPAIPPLSMEIPAVEPPTKPPNMVMSSPPAVRRLNLIKDLSPVDSTPFELSDSEAEEDARESAKLEFDNPSTGRVASEPPPGRDLDARPKVIPPKSLYSSSSAHERLAMERSREDSALDPSYPTMMASPPPLDVSTGAPQAFSLDDLLDMVTEEKMEIDMTGDEADDTHRSTKPFSLFEKRVQRQSTASLE